MSIVVPVYNGAWALENCVDRLVETLERIGRPYEVIIAEDGSTDESYEIALRLSTKYPRVGVVHRAERQGRGTSLSKTFGAARGDVICYMDVDLATDLSHLPKLIHEIQQGADVATGSRWIRGSEVRRGPLRTLLSGGFNLLVRALLGSRIRDHQCGFKGFRRSALHALLPEVRDGFWFWDTEILVLAQRRSYKVVEFPVDWKQHTPDTVVRVWRDTSRMLLAAIRLRWRLLTRRPSRDAQ